MCKHVAAVLYGVGVRLDEDPGLLFLLRGVEASDLISRNLALPEASVSSDEALNSGDLADIFGIEIEMESAGGNNKDDSGPAQVALAITSQELAFLPTGPAIAELRTDFDFTVAEFADLLGVTTASVYRWEKKPSAVRVQKRAGNRLKHMADIRREMLARNER